MTVLFITADQINLPTGGGLVCREEVKALQQQFGKVEVWDRTTLVGGNDPWGWDEVAVKKLEFSYFDGKRASPFRLCHVYSGSLPKTAAMLKSGGCKLTWTIAAHDRHVSRREHEQLGLQFPYTHLTEEPLWQHYIEGYRLADVIICPSTVAAATVRSYGPAFTSKDIRVVPHGTHLPDAVAPLPRRFTVGYLGSFGADKGVRYLLEAWKLLSYKDATLLLAGKDSTSDWARHLIRTYGGGNIECMGWVDDPTDFYNRTSLYVQPSATEGFGIEVLEAMAHGRPVICSRGAGAVDTIHFGWDVPACDAQSLTEAIANARKVLGRGELNQEEWRKSAVIHSWPKIHKKYQSIWQELTK